MSHDVWGADFGRIAGVCRHNCSHRGSHGGACMTCGCPTSALPGPAIMPDLTAELDAAEEIVTGRAEAIVTEWGSRDPEAASAVFEFRHLGEEAARGVVAHRNERGIPTVLVRRTVTYGPWEPVNPSAPPAGTGEDERP